MSDYEISLTDQELNIIINRLYIATDTYNNLADSGRKEDADDSKTVVSLWYKLMELRSQRR